MTTRDPSHGLPGFWISVFTILFPVLLMLAGSWADVFTAPGTSANSILRLVGNDDIALLIGVLLSFITLGVMRGFSRDTVLRFSTECLGPTAAITLLVGAGGGFGRILQDSGVSSRHHCSRAQEPRSTIAACLVTGCRSAPGYRLSHRCHGDCGKHRGAHRIALHGVHPELLAIATGAGSLIFSHVNDGGFWLIKEYFNMSVVQTMKTWSVCETIISVTALWLLATGLAFRLIQRGSIS